jgi:hypothetical protein
MVVIQVLGTPDASKEERLQTLTRDLLTLCRSAGYDDGYVVFPPDRMQWELGTEIVALVYLSDVNDEGFGREIGSLLRPYFPGGTRIGVQLVKARTVMEFAKKPLEP